jgi:hypothetical protein
MNESAYLDGYLHKEAWAGVLQGGVEATRMGKDVLESAIPYFLVAPALLGAGAGLLHSKVTSPTPMDEGAVQSALEASELEEFAAELKRRRKQEEIEKARSEQEKEKPSARSLHI